MKPHELIRPNLKTRIEDYSREERAKLESDGLHGNLFEEFRDRQTATIAWESQQIAKSHGIYLQWNRARTGQEKDWRYMIRFSIPGGGPLCPAQWRILDDLSDRYTANPDGFPSLRITTRQNLQFHWVRKEQVVEIVGRAAESGLFTLNGCGDNVRNIMACPLSRFSPAFDATAWARLAADYFRLPGGAAIEIFAIDPAYLRDPQERFSYAPNLLNRKFKIAFSAIHWDGTRRTLVPDNCVELRTNDIGVAPLVPHGEDGQVDRFQIYIGGGQGEKNGKPTFSALGEPFGIVGKDDLLKVLDAIVRIHQEWGDRQNRHWARMKYVVWKLGVDWFRDRVREIVGFLPSPPIVDMDHGPRRLHHGWQRQAAGGAFSFGAFIENGRIIDGPNGRLKSMVRHLMDSFPIRLTTTPNQDLLFLDIPPGSRSRFERQMGKFGYGIRNGKPYSRLRLHSGACVGRDTCPLTYTDSEKFEPSLIDELEKHWGSLAESVGVTGCERQCFRPGTKTIGWVGTGLDRYQLKLGGTEDGRHQGTALFASRTGGVYLRTVPRQMVARVTGVLFEIYLAYRLPGESMGYFHRRMGHPRIIQLLKADRRTAALLEFPFRAAWCRPVDLPSRNEEPLQVAGKGGRS